jgi:c(7)-type cytochrome triheme protein
VSRGSGVLVAGLALALAGLLAASDGGAQVKAPPDFALPKAEDSPGTVTFSHDVHVARVGKCTRCHMRDMKMKRGGSGRLTMEAMQEGKTCGACHDGKTTVNGAAVFALDECDRCHK